MRVFHFLVLSLALTSRAQQPSPLYQNDFETAPLGELPGEFLVLAGDFTVQQEEGNKFLQLPGTPLESFGLLFGPPEQRDITATARFFGTTRGRRAPTFALGLNGVAGCRLQVSPAKKLLEIFRGDHVVATTPYAWKPGSWTHLRVQVRQSDTGWVFEGKAWTQGTEEPAQWMISLEGSEPLSRSQAGLFASPFSGTPIRFDDLRIERLKAR